MARANEGSYAVGYFESWNLESLLAVADAAAATRSPVILGFSGIYLPHPDRVVKDPLGTYATMGLDVCRRLSVPACLLFNESPNLEWVFEAIELGFGLVMFTDDTLGAAEQTARVREVVARAHAKGAAVEAELASLPGLGGEATDTQGDLHLTDPKEAAQFVEVTGVDALAVNVGQVHLHGRRRAPLDLSRLASISERVKVPLVLHGASSIGADDMRAAIAGGIRKVNVGSVLKQRFLLAMRDRCGELSDSFNPYEAVGSGLRGDVLAAGRLAMRETAAQLMHLFGSAGNA
jgi:fructose/tagatose bisphosphate aldolase